MKDCAAPIRLMEAARAVSLKFERPFDTYFRLGFSDLFGGLALAGVELGIWKAIAIKSPDDVCVSELAKQLGMVESILARILRFAATQYMIDEVSEDVYRADNITHHFTASRADVSPAVRIGNAIPEFFTRHKMDDPAVARRRGLSKSALE